jgi:hypothetical protein
VRRRVRLAEVDEQASAVVVSPYVPHDNTQLIEVLDISAHPGQHT